MRRNPRRRLTVAAAVGAALMLISACSSSGGGTGTSAGTSTGTSAGTSAGPTGTAIAVGFLCSCAGPYAANNLINQDAADAWAQSVNAAGGINGHPVKVFTEDDAGNPTTALQLVKQLVEQDKIVALVGDNSVNSTAFAGYLAGKGIPVVGGTPSEAPFLSNPDFFTSGSLLPVDMAVLMLQMKKQGLKHLGLFYCAEAPVCAQLATLASAVQKAVPGIDLSSAEVAATSPNYTSQCVAFKSDGVDALYTGLVADTGLRVIDSCKQLGFSPKIVTQVATTGRSWLSDSNVDGPVLASPNANYEDSSLPGVKAFLDAMNKYHPGDADKPQFSGTTMQVWAGFELFEAAAKAGGIGPTSTPADVKKGLYALKDQTLDGLAPPLTFTPGNVAFPTCSFVLSIQGGNYTSQGAAPQCLTDAQAATLKTALGFK